MRTVILCPRRADGGHRDKLWAFARGRWEAQFPDWPVIEGHHDDGPFNRSAAVNTAARLAGDWDVALIIDADVICAPVAVESAVELAAKTDRLVVAHDERVMLSQRGTDKILAGYLGSWRTGEMLDRTQGHGRSGVWLDSVSCAVAVTRTLWEQAGPMDEAFVSWGREDTAFRISCEVETGPIVKVCGETFHLWHPVGPEVKLSSPLRQANEKRHKAYLDARGDRAAVRALRGADCPDLPATTIPRILHRTVPADTTEEVEGWWAEFARLHPGWDCRTYREPIDPAEWPLTGDLFDRCQNGAQKAGLIRLEALVRDGGVYVDADVKPFRSMEPLLRCEGFAGWEDETTVPDAVLGFRKGHPVLDLLITKARASIEGGAGAWLSGPGVTTEVLPGRHDVLLLPPGAFYPFHYLEKSKGPGVNAAPPPYAFLAHQWHHSWGTPEEKRSIERRQRTR